MAAAKDQECYQTYIEKLDDGDGKGELVQDNFDPEEGTVSVNVDNNGTIIMDADGNYYYQSSEKMVEVKPLTKMSEIPVKKVAAAVVFPANKRKNAAQASSETPKKLKLEEAPKQENVVKIVDETITSEVSNQEEVYEFEENEQDPDDPKDETAPAYECKGIIKNAKNTATNESASFTCMICSYETNKKFLLSRHFKTHSDDRPYKCSVCERGFKTNASLRNHRNTHLGYKPHACSSCDMAFTTSGELIRHVRYRHTHVKPHKCSECDYSSVEMSKLRRHMRCHTGERPYQCPHCTYASPDTFKLKRHMRIHTGEKPYECDICHARFTQSNSLKHHRLIHSVNEKPVFQCHLCPTTCGRKTDLRLHIKKLHSSDQPIPCKRCGKELPDRYSYKMHVKTHEGEKCYRCEYCPYASISQRHLESHVFIHLDTKPFVCEVCQTSFRQKPLLNRHLKMYHSDNYEPPPPRKKDHKCPHCNKMFAFNGNLIRHMEIHDPTSRLYEEKEKLREGRMKRVKPDGTVVTVTSSHTLSKLLDDNVEDDYYEETEEQEQVEDKEVQAKYEEADDFNEDSVQYLYDEYEADEYEEQDEKEQHKQQHNETNERKQSTNVKQEKFELNDIAQTTLTKPIIVKAEGNIVSDVISLELQDDQDFVVIEVLPDDEDDEEEQQEQEKAQEVKPTIIKIKPDKSTIEKSHKNIQPLISDYFGFEVNIEEEDEGTKEAIKLFEIIEQE